MADASLSIKLDAKDNTAAAFASLNRNMSSVSNSFSTLNSTISGFTRGAIGTVLAGSVSEAIGTVVRYADAWTLMQNRLRSAGLTAEQTATAQTKISDIASKTRSDLTETGNLYARVAFATENLGLKQTEVAQITETLSMAFKMSGRTALESQSAITQFTQALSSGVLAGDELKALKENAPDIARAIAKSLGVSVGQLKQLGEESKITAEVVVRAMQEAAPRIEATFMQTRKTYGDSLQLMLNALQEFIGRSDSAMQAHVQSMQNIGKTGNIMIDNAVSVSDAMKNLQQEIDYFNGLIDRGNEKVGNLKQQISGTEQGSTLFNQLTGELNTLNLAISSTQAHVEELKKGLVIPAPALPAPIEISAPVEVNQADQYRKTQEQLKDLNAEKQKYLANQQAIINRTQEETLTNQYYYDALKAGRPISEQEAQNLAKQKIAHDQAASAAKNYSSELENMIQKYAESADPLLKYREDLAFIEEAYKKGRISADQYASTVANIKTAMEKAAENADPLKKQTEELTRAFEGFGRKSADAIAEFVVEGKGNFSDLIKSIIKDIISMMIYQNVLKNLFSGFSGGFNIGSFLGLGQTSAPMLGHAATGGNIPYGRPTLVGEKGMEIFTPSSGGRITPNNQIGGANVSVNVINHSSSQATTTETTDGRGNRKIDVVIGEVVAKQIGQIGSSVNQSLRNTFNSAPALVGR